MLQNILKQGAKIRKGFFLGGGDKILEAVIEETIKLLYIYI